MRRCARHAVGAALALAVALGAPAAALANAYDQVLHEFQQTGTVNGCNYSEAQLQEAEKELAKSTAQVPAQFPTAVQAAIQQRKSGVCGSAAGATQTQTQAAPAPAPMQTAAPQTTPAPAATTTPQPEAAKQDTGGASSGVVMVAIAGALCLLLLALWGAARWWAFEPPWLLRWRHATAEAGWRASNAWAEFTDWLRLGR